MRHGRRCLEFYDRSEITSCCEDEKCRGTQSKNVLAIMHQGLDETVSKSHLHGPGLYLTPDSCKAMVYSDPDDQDIHAFA